MKWLGTYISNLAPNSDTTSLSTSMVVSGTLTPSQTVGALPSDAALLSDVRAFALLGGTISVTSARMEAAYTLCSTLTVASGQQVVSTIYVNPSSGDFNDRGARFMAMTPHGRCGMVFSSNGTFTYSSDNSSASAYLETDMPEALVEQPNGWYRMKLSMRMKSTGAIAPLLLSHDVRSISHSPLIYGPQVIVSAANTIDYMPPYIATTSTSIFSDQMSGVFLAVEGLRHEKRKYGVTHTTRSGARYAYQVGVRDYISAAVRYLSRSSALEVNSLWYGDVEVVLADGLRISEVFSGKLTNATVPISKFDRFGESDEPLSSLSGVIQLESF